MHVNCSPKLESTKRAIPYQEKARASMQTKPACSRADHLNELQMFSMIIVDTEDMDVKENPP